MLSNRNVVIGVLAIIAGLLVVFLANAFFTGVENRERSQAEQSQLVQILVASRPLAFGTALTPENTKLVGWPAGSIPEGAYRTSIGVVGNPKGPRVALRPIAVGEPILSSKISGADGRASISALLPDGMRAAAVKIDAVSGVGGLISPGDVVDVLVTRKMAGEASDADQMTDIVLENLRVIAVDQMADENRSQPKEATVAKTVTLEVDPVGAQKLALAQEIGSVSLALRNVSSREYAATASVTQFDLSDNGWRPAPQRRGQSTSPGLAGLPPGFLGDMTGAGSRAPRGGVRSAPVEPPRPPGPSMEIVRGTNSTTYEVNRHGN